ncbi:MAG: RloB domain-containing protein [Chlorobi bacterium]|nr:RloB domain-containing protein [Chlorobiota bacterium]
MRRKNIKISRPKNNTFAIVVDGETEVWYFQMLKRNEPFLQVNIEPKIPQKKKLSDQYKKVCELSEDYTKVFWVIDLDVVIAESKINELKEYINELKKEEFNNVITIFNNPCLEFWFLLHFTQTTKYFSKCKETEKQLKKQKEFKDYQKTRKYFTKQDNDIYLKLKSRLSTALTNAKKTKRKNLEEVKRGICEMNLFFETEQIKSILK